MFAKRSAPKGVRKRENSKVNGEEASSVRSALSVDSEDGEEEHAKIVKKTKRNNHARPAAACKHFLMGKVYISYFIWF